VTFNEEQFLQLLLGELDVFKFCGYVDEETKVEIRKEREQVRKETIEEGKKTLIKEETVETEEKKEEWYDYCSHENKELLKDSDLLCNDNLCL